MAARRRGSETLRDMALSLGVVAAIVLGFYLLQPPDNPSPIRAADSGDLSSALGVADQAAPWPVVDPVPLLPEEWTVTVARTRLPDEAGAGPVVLQVVLVTPDEEFVEVTETGADAAAVVRDSAGSRSPTDATADVAGTTWRVWPPAGKDGRQTAWSWTSDGRATVVRASAPEQDLRRTADALVQAAAQG